MNQQPVFYVHLFLSLWGYHRLKPKELWYTHRLFWTVVLSVYLMSINELSRHLAWKHTRYWFHQHPYIACFFFCFFFRTFSAVLLDLAFVAPTDTSTTAWTYKFFVYLSSLSLYLSVCLSVSLNLFMSFLSLSTFFLSFFLLINFLSLSCFMPFSLSRLLSQCSISLSLSLCVLFSFSLSFSYILVLSLYVLSLYLSISLSLHTFSLSLSLWSFSLSFSYGFLSLFLFSSSLSLSLFL